MLVFTFKTSGAWQPFAPQVSAATRRSPGLTNFTYSYLSRSHLVYSRGGFADVFASSGSVVWGCPRFFCCSYSAELGFATACATTFVSPPWQSMHASRTVRVGCIEGSSVDTWQEIHPVFFRSTSA